MSLYLIGYDLTEGEDYEGLWDDIKSIGEWLHPLDSTWFVYTSDTNVTPNTITDKLKPHFSNTNRLFVVPVTRPYQGLLTETQWKFINDNVNR